jgi:hypothetical protein
VAKAQGIDLRPEREGGDINVGGILIIRTGFLKHSRGLSKAEKEAVHLRPLQAEDGNIQRYIGLEQSEEICDFLHDSYFSAVAGDQPAFEAWPTTQGKLQPRNHSWTCKLG